MITISVKDCIHVFRSGGLPGARTRVALSLLCDGCVVTISRASPFPFLFSLYQGSLASKSRYELKNQQGMRHITLFHYLCGCNS